MVKRALLTIFIAIAGIPFVCAEMPEQASNLAVPAGTMLHCRNTETLTTKLNVRGDAFKMNVAEPVNVNGSVAIPAGSMLAGHITYMERPGRIKGVGQMRLSVEKLTLPDGRSFPLNAALMTSYGANNVKVVGTEGLIKGPTSRVPDFEEIGAGTVGGTLVGLIFAHPLIGATAALTATAVDRMRRRGKELTIPVGTEFNYQLTRELLFTREVPRVSAEVQVHGAGE